MTNIEAPGPSSYQAARAMLIGNSVSGNYGLPKPYLGRDKMRPIPSVTYTSNSSKGIDYNLNLGSSYSGNKNSNSGLYSSMGKDPLYDLLKSYS